MSLLSVPMHGILNSISYCIQIFTNMCIVTIQVILEWWRLRRHVSSLICMIYCFFSKYRKKITTWLQSFYNVFPALKIFHILRCQFRAALRSALYRSGKKRHLWGVHSYNYYCTNTKLFVNRFNRKCRTFKFIVIYLLHTLATGHFVSLKSNILILIHPKY